jgi:hypothetical protein
MPLPVAIALRVHGYRRAGYFDGDADLSRGFDGRWQANFSDLTEAVQWAREVAESGRMVFVVKRRFRNQLVAVFPEEKEDEGRNLWNRHQEAWMHTTTSA